jgi:hypothetical protein
MKVGKSAPLLTVRLFSRDIQMLLAILLQFFLMMTPSPDQWRRLVQHISRARIGSTNVLQVFIGWNLTTGKEW